MIVRQLRPVRDPKVELNEIEKRLKRLFFELVYKPILGPETLPERILNDLPKYPGLHLALSTGRLTFYNGTFSGKLNSKATKELKDLGATWDSRNKVFKLPKDKLPAEVIRLVNVSEGRFVEKLDRLDSKLGQVLDKKVWKDFLFSDLFDKAILRMDKEFRKNVEAITVQPAVTKFQAEKISEDWQNNLERSIKTFTEKEVQELRGQIKDSYFSGDRYGSLIKSIQGSYGVTERKAEFLARQETKNLTATYQGARYTEAGIPGYYWKAVAGTATHPTRHRHRQLSEMSDRGKVFYWDKPPVTTEPGQPVRRNNPGEDFNCRCSAIPVYQGK